MEIGLKAKLQALTAPTRAQLKSRILMQTKECSQIQLHEALKMYANGFMYNHALVVYEIMVQRYPSLSKATHDIGLGCLFDLRKDAMPLFRALPQKDEYMYRSVLAGLMRNKRFSEALQVFGMIKKDTLEDRNLHLSILYQQNDKEAFKWTSKAADQGNAKAEFNLGACYLQGTGIQKNETEAFKWYKKSAMKDVPLAQYNLGVLYQNGIGVEKNEAEAMTWLTKSADQGNAEAKKAMSSIKGEADARRMLKDIENKETVRREKVGNSWLANMLTFLKERYEQTAEQIGKIYKHKSEIE
jgi:pentatricopeptide repeat protein